MKKKIILLLTLLPILTACNKSLNIKITNTIAVDRENETVELDLHNIYNQNIIRDKEDFIIEDIEGEEIPYQLTYDNKIVFNVSIKAQKETNFFLRKGKSKKYDIKACGSTHSERLDDLAWENNLIGFRAYGPAFQQRGDRAFGYDIFAKRNTDKPILDELYAKACDPKIQEKVKALRQKDSKAAEIMLRNISYHVDHGFGMDCYSVGPTLGAGAAALINNENDIIYPWCYQSCDILDNGPLRFTARLVFQPTKYKGTTIIESRIITLDTGSHMNRTEISYKGLTDDVQIVSGIAIHQGSDRIEKSSEKGYIIYEDPTTGTNQGKLFIGNVYPKPLTDTRIVLFSDKERKMHDNALGHILAESTYKPNEEFIYYWGAGWDRSDIKNFEAWKNYIEAFSLKIKYPLIVTIH